MPAAPGAKLAAAIGGQIFLRVQKLLQKAVLENIQLVHIERAIQLDGVIADVARFDGDLACDLAFNAERPLLHIRRAQVGIVGV